MTAVNGDLVRKARLRQGLTQQQVIDRIGEQLDRPVKDNLLSKIESGGLGCAPKVIPALAAALGVTVDELVTIPDRDNGDEAAL